MKAQHLLHGPMSRIAAAPLRRLAIDPPASVRDVAPLHCNQMDVSSVIWPPTPMQPRPWPMVSWHIAAKVARTPTATT
jgi:hypothetical protein